MEMCSGCGAMAPKHPVVGITRDQETGKMAAFPVCGLCHRDPAHREHQLKMHFFDRTMESQAVKDAENNILCGPPPPL
jgi:hypothetical protein